LLLARNKEAAARLGKLFEDPEGVLEKTVRFLSFVKNLVKFLITKLFSIGP
jgi:hypothetical protein